MATVQETTDVEAATETALKLLEVLFDPDDAIAFRSIEMWSEGGKKRSKVDYDHTRGHRAGGLARGALRSLVQATYDQGTNLLFGVCPRGGPKGYDLAWQVRKVPALWADLDDCRPDEALERVAWAGLPRPTAVVSSGNGTHLYWKLSEPYVIDDVGAPPKVQRERIERDGRPIVVRYYLEAGQKVYLDKGRGPRLSPKAHRIQNVVAGVAEAIGGDCVYDLARVMRLPGPPNRKDHRIGTEPKPTKLVECDPVTVYSLSTFERFAKPTKEAVVAQMPVPRRLEKIGRSRLQKLDDRVAACRVAEKGQRSEADFALCCYAVGEGIPKDRVWQEASAVGKFAEGGERYFDRTWEAAEDRIRVRKYETLQEKTKPKAKGNIERPADASGPRAIVDIGDGNQVDDVFRQVTETLLERRGYYLRAEQLCVVRGDSIRSLLTAHELAGQLSIHCEFRNASLGREKFVPLPTTLGCAYLANPIQLARLPEISLYARNPVFADDWRLVEPGYDAQSGIYNAGPNVEARQGTRRLDELLQDFCFRTEGDRTNYLGVLLTMLMGRRFIGSKPGVLFNGNQPNLGKTVAAQLISILRDGRPAETVTYNPNDEEFEKRLAAAVRGGALTVIVDNAKTQRRSHCIESACLERSLTDAILSFRLLGSSQTIRVENSHTFCITANAPDVGRDLVTRCVVVNLEYAGDPSKRRFRIADPESFAADYRSEILGELVGMVERWKSACMPLASTHTRFNKRGWGDTIGGILAHAGLSGFLDNADEAATELDETKRDFVQLLEAMIESSAGQFTSMELVELASKHRLLERDLGDGSEKSKATRLGKLVTRFVGERFDLEGGAATFLRREGRITHYCVDVETPTEDF